MLCEAIEYTYGTHTEDDVVAMILGGKLTLWKTDKAACVTEFSQYPQMKILNVFIGGGDLEELIRIRDDLLVPFAEAHGCKRITGVGRPGWSRVLPGYTNGGISMYKDIA